MKRVVTAQDIPVGGEVRVPVGSIVTASAHEVAAARGVRYVNLEVAKGHSSRQKEMLDWLEWNLS